MKLLNAFKKNYFWKILIVVAPLGVLLGIHYLNGWIFSDGSSDGWLGFWGGYLGALLGLYGIQIQLKSDKKVRLEDSHPAFYLFFRTTFEPAEKVYVNSHQPQKLIGIIDQRNVLKFESKYSYSESNFISIVISNKKSVHDVSILVTSVVADAYVKVKFKNSGNVNDGAEEQRWELFKADIKNWSEIQEGIKASSLDGTDNGTLLVTYAQLHNYQNKIQKVDIIFHTDADETGIATFKLKKDGNGVPQLSNVPEVEYVQRDETTPRFSKKIKLFKENYTDTTIMIVDENDKEKFVWRKELNESQSHKSHNPKNDNSDK